MEILQVINLNLLHTYSNVDFSTVHVGLESCRIIAKLDYDKFSMLIDIFDDVNKCENNKSASPSYTLADNIIFMIYNSEFGCTLTNEQQMKILFKLLVRNFKEYSCNYYYANHDRFDPREYTSYNVHKSYFNKYYDAIVNLFRLTNSDTIEICNLNDSVINAIRVLLSVTKTRVLPKYVILHLLHINSPQCLQHLLRRSK